MAACGDKSADTPAADTHHGCGGSRSGSGRRDARRQNGDGGNRYKFVPAELSVGPGDQVVFHNVSGGPHNVAFWADSIPAGAKEVIDPQLKDQIATLSSALVVDPNAHTIPSRTRRPVSPVHLHAAPRDGYERQDHRYAVTARE